MSNMLNITNSNSEYLHNYIKKVARKEQASVDTSNVYTGTIIAAASGIYTVNLNQSNNSSNVYAVTITSEATYEKKDYVYLLKADSTSDVNYFIFGKVDAVQETFFNLSDAERFIEDKDALIEAPSFEVSTTSIVVNDNNLKNFCQRIKNLGYFRFEASIVSGSEYPYGFKIKFLNDEVDVESFIFNSYEFVGQPNTQEFNGNQIKVFHLTKDSDFNKIIISKLSKDEGYDTNFSANNVQLVAGSLLEISAAYQNNISAENNRNYFEKGTNKLNTIKLISKVYYNNQPLLGDAVQYYWLLKDDNFTDEDSNDYLSYAGNGWRCLNAFDMAVTAENQNIRLWNNKNNFIVLDKTSHFIENLNFTNKIKCLVKYFDQIIESDEIDIFNYEYERFSATISASVDPVTIISREDVITLECNVTNNNDKINLNDYVIKYKWYRGEAPEKIENISDSNLEKNLKASKIMITDKLPYNKFEKEEENILEINSSPIKLFCVATIYHKNDVAEDGGIILGAKPVSEEISNTITVDSVAAATDIQEIEQYKYYIADNHQVSFMEKTDSSSNEDLSSWTGDWDIIDGEKNNSEWIGGTENEVFYDTTIFEDKYITQEYFVYYTKRMILKRGEEILRKEKSSFPQIARSVIYEDNWKNFRIGNNINQLNTFNQLTNNGTEDAIEFAELPILTKDTEPNVTKTYLKRAIDNQGNISYAPFELINTEWDFKDNFDYYINSGTEGNPKYEKVDTKNSTFNIEVTYYQGKKSKDELDKPDVYTKLEVNKNNFKLISGDWPDWVKFNNENYPLNVYEGKDQRLFINATYIRSGTLEVNDKFYASIDNDDVKIAGFTVNEDSIEAGDINNGPYVKLSKGGLVVKKATIEAHLVKSIEIYYLQNNSASDIPKEDDSNWSTNYPEWQDGKYIWQKTKTFYADSETPDIEIICLTGARGATGEQGPQGEKGDKGDQGEQGSPGKDGIDGSNGEDASYITSIIEQYFLSSSADEPVGPAIDQNGTGQWIDIKENATIPIVKGYLPWRRQKYQWNRKPGISEAYEIDGVWTTYSVAKLDATDQRIVNWCIEEDTTKIDGSKIFTGTINTDQLNVNAIRSYYFPTEEDENGEYIPIIPDNDFPEGGTFLDLNSGDFYTPNLISTSDGLKVRGEIIATALTIAPDVAEKAGLTTISGKNLLLNSEAEQGGKVHLITTFDLSPIITKYGEGIYTLSFDVRTDKNSSDNGVYTTLFRDQEYIFDYNSSHSCYFSSTTVWTRKAFIVKIKKSIATATKSTLYFNGAKSDPSVIPYIKNVKLEIGEVDGIPEWTPAAEFETEFIVDPANDLISLKSKTLKFQSNDLIIDTDNFKFNTAETGENNLIITGTINAPAGNIGGFHIASDHLADGVPNEDGNTNNHLVMLSPGLNDYVFWAGEQSKPTYDDTRPFWIKKDGSIKATSGFIGGFTLGVNTLTAGSGTSAIGLSSSDNIAFWAGDTDKNSAPLRIFTNGRLEIVDKDNNLIYLDPTTSGFNLSSSGVRTLVRPGSISFGRIYSYEENKSSTFSINFSESGTIISHNYHVGDSDRGKRGITIDSPLTTTTSLTTTLNTTYFKKDSTNYRFGFYVTGNVGNGNEPIISNTNLGLSTIKGFTCFLLQNNSITSNGGQVAASLDSNSTSISCYVIGQSGNTNGYKVCCFAWGT